MNFTPANATSEATTDPRNSSSDAVLARNIARYRLAVVAVAKNFS
ncbi:hypothetical protein [Cellulosimicrobium funkei]|nr:hypothetical protein SAMN04487781_1404 [Cellulosimicrobium cellulans]